MKKLFVIALLTLFSNGAFSQTLKIVNSTSCDLKIEIQAEQLPTYKPCALQSNLFIVPAGTSSPIFTDLPSVYSWPGWLGGATPIAGAHMWGWT